MTILAFFEQASLRLQIAKECGAVHFIQILLGKLLGTQIQRVSPKAVLILDCLQYLH